MQDAGISFGPKSAASASENPLNQTATYEEDARAIYIKHRSHPLRMAMPDLGRDAFNEPNGYRWLEERLLDYRFARCESLRISGKLRPDNSAREWGVCRC